MTFTDPSPRHERAIDSQVLDEYRAIDARGGGGDFVTRLIDQYLAESTSRMAELKDAIERRDAPAVRRTAHSLKGSSGTVGAGRMAEICGELDQLARNMTFDGTSTLVVALDDEFKRVRDALQLERGIAG